MSGEKLDKIQKETVQGGVQIIKTALGAYDQESRSGNPIEPKIYGSFKCVGLEEYREIMAMLNLQAQDRTFSSTILEEDGLYIERHRTNLSNVVITENYKKQKSGKPQLLNRIIRVVNEPMIKAWNSTEKFQI
jgi:hypothetical protein